MKISCPSPKKDKEQILLGHGGGGRLMNDLIGSMFVKSFANPLLDQGHDSTIITIGDQRIAFTTDSFVVDPIFFPGGDIGTLAVYGTINDLAASGAKPCYLSCAFIIEEGFSRVDLQRVVDSIKQAADDVGVKIVTGDTKVVPKGKGDKIYVNTAGIGIIEHEHDWNPLSIAEGDQIILTGDIGRHGMAIMAQREGMEFENVIKSDCAPLNHLSQALIDAKVKVACCRDLTRGGLVSAVVEIATHAKKRIILEQENISVDPSVRGVCEVLGLDPLYVANEGRCIFIVKKEDAIRAVDILRQLDHAKQATIIGEIKEGDYVLLKDKLGSLRILDMISGEQLPRIC